MNEQEGMKMIAGTIIWIIAAALVVCCFTHRRVIRALIGHEPMLKAPRRHVRVSRDGWRSGCALRVR